MVRGKKIEKNILQEELGKYDLIWIGEIHGVKENYSAYKTILPNLAENGFRNILWEMRADFSEKSKYTEDGRINQFSIEFLKWIEKQIKTGKIDGLTFFGNKTPRKNGAESFGYEEEMADEVIEIVGNTKSVIITGNYHMMDLTRKDEREKPAANFVKEKSELKILRMYLKYSKGSFYNFGHKKLTERATDKEIDLKFGTITRLNDLFFFHMGQVRAVFKNPTTR